MFMICFSPKPIGPIRIKGRKNRDSYLSWKKLEEIFLWLGRLNLQQLTDLRTEKVDPLSPKYFPTYSNPHLTILCDPSRSTSQCLPPSTELLLSSSGKSLGHSQALLFSETLQGLRDNSHSLSEFTTYHIHYLTLHGLMIWYKVRESHLVIISLLVFSQGGMRNNVARKSGHEEPSQTGIMEYLLLKY